MKLLKDDGLNIHIKHPSGKILIISKEKLNPEAVSHIQKLAKGGDVNPKLAQVPEADRFPNAVNTPKHFDVGGTAQGEPVSESTPAPQPPVINNHYYMAPGNNPMPTPSPQAAPQAPSNSPAPSSVPSPVASSPADNSDWTGSSGVATPSPADANAAQNTPAPTTKAPAAPLDLIQQAQNAESSEEGSIKNISKAQQVQDASNALALDAQQKFLQDQQARETQLGNKYHADWDAIANNMNPNIDPNHFWSSQDTPSKISSAIGFMIAGAGMGLAGHPEAGRQAIDNAINRDIDAQKATFNQQGNLLREYTDHYHSAIMGEDALRLQYGAQLENQIKRAAAQFGTQTASDNANILIQQNRTKLVGNMTNLAQGQAAIDMANQKRKILSQINNPNQGTSNQDPALLVPALVPEGDRKQVFDEIKNSQNITANGPKILAAFDEATKQHLTDYVPGTSNKGQMSLHQLLLPNFKSIDGTVRQAAMDETFANVTPKFGDTKDKIATKREALVNWLHSEASAPTAKGYGIDLNKYSSTQEKDYTPAQTSKIQVFMKQNPQVQSTSEAAQILKQNGYL